GGAGAGGSPTRKAVKPSYHNARSGLSRQSWGPAGPPRASLLAAASEPALADGIAGLLAFAKELHVAHDRLAGMLGPPVRDVGLVVGDADHQRRRRRGPLGGGARRLPRAIEQVLQVRLAPPPHLHRRTRPRSRSPADWPVPSRCSSRRRSRWRSPPARTLPTAPHRCSR